MNTPTQPVFTDYPQTRISEGVSNGVPVRHEITLHLLDVFRGEPVTIYHVHTSVYPNTSQEAEYALGIAHNKADLAQYLADFTVDVSLIAN